MFLSSLQPAYRYIHHYYNIYKYSYACLFYSSSVPVHTSSYTCVWRNILSLYTNEPRRTEINFSHALSLMRYLGIFYLRSAAAVCFVSAELLPRKYRTSRFIRTIFVFNCVYGNFILGVNRIYSWSEWLIVIFWNIALFFTLSITNSKEWTSKHLHFCNIRTYIPL